MSSFAKYLPSKGFLAVSIAVLFSIGLVGGVFVSSRSEISDTTLRIPTIASVSEIASNIESELSSKDSDEDGLKDWEESLWGTNMNNKDSDEDGTFDGEEVKIGRNPTIKGPGDLIAIKSTEKESGGETEKLTTTDKISRIAFARYLQVKQSGGTVDDVFEKQLLSEIVSTQSSDLKRARPYTEGDLQIVDSDNKKLVEFADKMGKIIMSATWGQNELEIVKNALDKEDERILRELDKSIDGYSRIIDESIKIPVPKNIVREHLMFLNAISQMINSLQAAKLSFSDPAIALALFGRYPDHITSLHKAFIDIQGLYSRNNITFGEKDSGLVYARFADIAVEASKNISI